MKQLVLIFLLTLTTACAGFSGKQDQDVETGDNSIVNQQASQNDGSSKVDATNVDSVSTINEGNISIGMLAVIIAGAGIFGIIFGVLIPQPAIIKRIW